MNLLIVIVILKGIYYLSYQKAEMDCPIKGNLLFTIPSVHMYHMGVTHCIEAGKIILRIS